MQYKVIFAKELSNDTNCHWFLKPESEICAYLKISHLNSINMTTCVSITQLSSNLTWYHTTMTQTISFSLGTIC